MISFKNILTISSYEARVLWRNWFFRIIALMGVGFIAMFNTGVFSELSTPSWSVLSNSWILPYSTMIMIGIPQAAAVIFLATGLVKKDRKLDTNEVFFVRPISNLDYVFGKALALIALFILLNMVLLCIPLVVGLTSPYATINPIAFAVSPLLTTIPSIVFTTGMSFLLVTVIRNQPISIVLLIGITGVQLIYYFDQFSNILDFTGFRLSMVASEMTGFVDIGFALWQRTFYFLTGIAFLFMTAFLLDRLSATGVAHRLTGIIGVLLLSVCGVLMARVWEMRQDPIMLREQMITVNGKWSGVPNVDIVTHSIELELAADGMISTSAMRVRNNTGGALEKIYFTLNPGLRIESASINGEEVEFQRDLQIASIDRVGGIAPGEELLVTMKYSGAIVEAAAHLEVEPERYESPNEHMVYAIKKKYAFLEEDYVLLTRDVLWYPDTQVGFNRQSATGTQGAFVVFRLKVTAPPGIMPVSQGEVLRRDHVYQFTPEYPLPGISLVIGNYEKKEITVGGVSYAVFHNPNNDFFVRHLDQLADTLSHLITDAVHEYEDAQKIAYPFRRLQFVEVPIHFFGYSKIYESHQSYLQPEMVFWPEEGGKISQFDFRKQLLYISKQSAQANQVLTEKQKQASMFNDLVKRVFTKQTGSAWVYDGKNADQPDYSIFPNYFSFNSGIVSKEWPLLNRSIASYLRNDKQTLNDYSRNINGISFAEECNMAMRESSVTDLLTQADFNKISRSVALKSQYLFSYLGSLLGEKEFKAFLFRWVNTHSHQLTDYANFRKAMKMQFNLDLDPIIRKVYSDTSQPAFEVLDVQKYEVMDGDRKRYQVLLTIKNSGDNDGVIEVRLNTGENTDGDNYFAVKVNEEVREEEPARLSVIQPGETKLLGFVLDEKPNDIHINTIISRNIPSVITIPAATLSKGGKALLFEGERITEERSVQHQYEVIVDNEDPGFTTFSPVKPTILKAYLDRKNADRKYYGNWSGAHSNWLATTGSNFYGTVVRSSHFTQSGAGDKLATWTPELRQEGIYDVYVYMKGKNQNQFTGPESEGRQLDYHYVVRHADGTDHVKYNITSAEPGWNYLGSYYFTRAGGNVSLTDRCDLPTVYADAVKWVKQ